MGTTKWGKIYRVTRDDDGVLAHLDGRYCRWSFSFALANFASSHASASNASKRGELRVSGAKPSVS